MFKISVMYPWDDGIHFDFDYYKKNHMKMVKDHLKPFGLVKTEILRGLSWKNGEAATYLCIGNLYFKNIDDYYEGIESVGNTLSDDIPNFTNAVPIRQLSEIL